MTFLTRQTSSFTSGVGLHALGLLPMVLLMGAAILTIVGAMGPIEFLAVSGVLGDVTLILFTAMLACTPLHIVFGWRWVLKFKKPLGLYTFLYAVTHYLVFLGGFDFALGLATGEIWNSAMLLFGFASLMVMLPLALTSNVTAMRLLGKSWKVLHRLTYLAAIFIALHLVYLGDGQLILPLYTVLLAVRLPSVKRQFRQLRKHRSGMTAASR